MAPSRTLRRPAQTTQAPSKRQVGVKISKLKPPNAGSRIPRRQRFLTNYFGRKAGIPIKRRTTLAPREKKPLAKVSGIPKQAEEEFVADPNALASILNNDGISTNPFEANQTGCALLDAQGRPSLCRRIPRGSSVYVDPSRPSLSKLPGRISKGIESKPVGIVTRRTAVNGKSESLYSAVKSRYAFHKPDPAPVEKKEFLPPRPSTAKRGKKIHGDFTNDQISSPMLRLPRNLPPKSPAMRVLRTSNKESSSEDEWRSGISDYKDKLAVALFLNDEEEEPDKVKKDSKSVMFKFEQPAANKVRGGIKQQHLARPQVVRKLETVTKRETKKFPATTKKEEKRNEDVFVEEKIVSPKVINECKPMKREDKKVGKAASSRETVVNDSQSQNGHQQNEMKVTKSSKIMNCKFSRKVDIDVVLNLLQKNLKSVRRRTVFSEVESIINNVQNSLVREPDEAKKLRDEAKKLSDSPPTSLAEIKKSPSKRPSPEPVVKGTTPPKIWKDLLKEDCTTHKTVPPNDRKMKPEAATKADIDAFKQNLKEIEKVQQESSILEEKIRDLQITKQSLEKQTTTESVALKVISNNTKKDDSFNAKFDSCDRLMQRIRSYKPTSNNIYSFYLNTSNKENVTKTETKAVKSKSHEIQTNLQPSKYIEEQMKTTNTTTLSTTVVPTSATHLATTPSLDATSIKSSLNLKSPPGNPELKWIQSIDAVSSGRLQIDEDKIDPLLSYEEEDTCVAYSVNIKALHTEKSTLKTDSSVAPKPTLKAAEVESSFISRHEAHVNQIQSNCYDANNSLFLETMKSIQSRNTTEIDSSKHKMKDNTGDEKQEKCISNKGAKSKTVPLPYHASSIFPKRDNGSGDTSHPLKGILSTSTEDEIKGSCENNKPLNIIKPDYNNKTSFSTDHEDWFPSNNFDQNDDDLTAAIDSSSLFKIKPSGTGHFLAGQPVVVPKVTMPPPPATPQLLRRLKPKLNNTPKKSFLQPEKYKSPFVKPSPNKVAKYRKKSYFSPSAKKSTQRFTEALLDEEVALLTCRRFQSKQERNYENPVSMFLQHGDDKHFIPLSPEVQQNKENRFGSAFSTYAT